MCLSTTSALPTLERTSQSMNYHKIGLSNSVLRWYLRLVRCSIHQWRVTMTYHWKAEEACLDSNCFLASTRVPNVPKRCVLFCAGMLIPGGNPMSRWLAWCTGWSPEGCPGKICKCCSKQHLQTGHVPKMSHHSNACHDENHWQVVLEVQGRERDIWQA